MVQLLSLALAQESPGPPSPSGGAFLTSLLPFVLIFVLFYVLLILPQQRRQKKHRAMLETLKKGDRVVTSNGILGTVMNLSKDVITLQVADNVKIRVLRDSISDMRKEDEGG
jgi:preprotein translocase subunit YajC